MVGRLIARTRRKPSRALKLRVNFIDTTDAYGLETRCGGLIAVCPRQPICGRRIRRWRGKRGPNRPSGADREFSLAARWTVKLLHRYIGRELTFWAHSFSTRSVVCWNGSTENASNSNAMPEREVKAS